MRNISIVITIIAVFTLVSCGKIGKTNDRIETQMEQVNKDDSNNVEENKVIENTDTEAETENVTNKDSINRQKEKQTSATDLVSQIDYNNHINDFSALKDSVKSNSNAINNCYFCKYGTIAYVVYAIAIIILFVILRIIWMVATAKSPEAKKKEESEKQRLNKNINELNWRISELKSQYDTLNLKVRNLSNDVTSIGDNIVREGSKVTNDNDGRLHTNNTPARETPQQSRRQSVFYLKFPGIDGLFDDSPVSKNDAYYKFELYQHNPDTAKFTFMPGNETIMRRAMNNRSDYIEKACEPANTVEGMATTCIPVRGDFGEAKLVNGKWYITRKQKVIYE